jgi:hypothetical protein
MPITDYGDLKRGYEGQPARQDDYLARSAVNAGSTVLPFGYMVSFGSVPGDAIAYNGTGALGVAVKTDVYEKSDETVADGVMGYEPGRPVGYLKRGVINVKAQTAVTAQTDAAVYTSGPVGGFGASGTAAATLEGAVGKLTWLDSVGAGEIAPLDVIIF